MKRVIATVLVVALILLGVPAPVRAGLSYFVSPTGSGSTCSIGSPCALSRFYVGGAGSLSAGDTLWLRGGTYTSTRHGDQQTVYPLAVGGGTGQSPVIIRGYPGELATLDCQTAPDFYRPGGCVVVTSPHTWLWGVEIASLTAGPNGATAPYRQQRVVGTFGPVNYGPGFTPAAAGVRLINSYVHETFIGLGSDSTVKDLEYYGDIVFNNGNDGVRGSIDTVTISGTCTGCVNYTPVDGGDPGDDIGQVGRPQGTVTGPGWGSPATFVPLFRNGVFDSAYVTSGGSPNGNAATTCTMPTGGNGSGATCTWTEDPVLGNHTIVAVSVGNPGSGYLSIGVTGSHGFGTGAFASAYKFSGSNLTNVTMKNPPAGPQDYGTGKDFCTTASGPCTADTVTCTVYGAGVSGLTCTAHVFPDDRAHGHGAYLKSKENQRVYDVMSFNNFGNQEQDFVSDIATNSIRNIKHDGCIFFCNDGPQRPNSGGSPFTISGDNTWGNHITDSVFYAVDSARGGLSGANQFKAAQIRSSIITGNRFVSYGGWASVAPDVGVGLIDFLGTTIGGSAAAKKNTFVGPAYPDPAFKNAFPNNTYYGGEGVAYPTVDESKCRPNRYEQGRGHCWIFAWSNINAQTGAITSNSITRNLDISSIVPVGYNYKIYSAENPLGATVATGTCSPNCTAVPVTLSTSAIVASVVGSAKVPKTTQPVFGVFIITTSGLPPLVQ